MTKKMIPERLNMERQREMRTQLATARGHHLLWAGVVVLLVMGSVSAGALPQREQSVHQSLEGEECPECESIKVEVPGLGSAIGFINVTFEGNKRFAGFLGLPFAKTPKRFEPPDALEEGEWGTDRQARVRAKTCPQGKFYPGDLLEEGTGAPQPLRHFAVPAYDIDEALTSEGADESEDCLTMDIYTPDTAVNTSARLPVLFFVHGGAFVRGSSRSARPTFLLDYTDVVIVAPQYRLGPLGFLVAGGTNRGKGNQGLHDQRVALEWTVKYVEAFGGDPTNIIVGGVSAGGATSGLLYASPRTSDKVSAAMLFSGTAVSPWTLDENPRLATKGIASMAGCHEEVRTLMEAEDAALAHSSADSDEKLRLADEGLRECLDDVPTDLLLNATFFYAVTEKSQNRLGMGGTIPVLDGDMLPQKPEALISAADFRGKPMMVGVTRDEGLYLYVQVHYFYMVLNNLTEDYNLHARGMGDVLLTFANSQDDLHVLGLAVERLYFHDDQLGNYSLMEDGIIDFTGAGFFKAPAHHMALLNNEAGGESWLYTFNYESVQERELAATEKRRARANHGTDQIYLFPARDDDFVYHKEDYGVVKTFCTAVSNFIAHHDPRGSEKTEVNGAEWPPLKSADGGYVRITKNSAWDSLKGWDQEYHATNGQKLPRNCPAGASSQHRVHWILLLVLTVFVIFATRRSAM